MLPAAAAAVASAVVILALASSPRAVAGAAAAAGAVPDARPPASRGAWSTCSEDQGGDVCSTVDAEPRAAKGASMLQSLKPMRIKHTSRPPGEAHHFSTGAELQKATPAAAPGEALHRRPGPTPGAAQAAVTLSSSSSASVLPSADKEALGWDGRAGAVAAGLILSIATLAALAPMACGDASRIPVSIQLALLGRGAKHRGERKASGGADGSGGAGAGGSQDEPGEQEGAGKGAGGDAGDHSVEESAVDDSDSTDEYGCPSQAYSSASDPEEIPATSSQQRRGAPTACEGDLGSASATISGGVFLGSSCAPMLPAGTEETVPARPG